MKYHPLNSIFSVTYKPSGEVAKYAVREAATYEEGGETYRKSCETCAFSVMREQYANGCIRLVRGCRFSHPMEAKCTPKYREDGKIIEYKRRRA